MKDRANCTSHFLQVHGISPYPLHDRCRIGQISFSTACRKFMLLSSAMDCREDTEQRTTEACPNGHSGKPLFGHRHVRHSICRGSGQGRTQTHLAVTDTALVYAHSECQYSKDLCNYIMTCKPFRKDIRKNYSCLWLLHVHTCTITIVDPCS